MKKSLILLSIIAVVAIAVLVFSFSRSEKNGTDNGKSLTPGDSSVVPADTVSVPSFKPSTSELFIRDFKTYSRQKKLEEIDKLLTSARHNRELVSYLHEQVANKDLGNVVRNDIANVLVRQENPVQGLLYAFSSMAEDKSENTTWREFAVQHFANMYDHSNEKQEVEKQLLTWFRSKDKTLAPTAMVQLTNLAREGKITLPKDASASFADVAGDEKQSINTRISALHAIGQSGDKSKLPLVRGYAAGTNTTLKRVACAVLSQIGEADDIRILEANTTHKNPAVSIAATEALKKLQ